MISGVRVICQYLLLTQFFRPYIYMRVFPTRLCFFAVWNTAYMATYRLKLILPSYSSVGSIYQISLLLLRLNVLKILSPYNRILFD